jgi:hypothetical protein
LAENSYPAIWRAKPGYPRTAALRRLSAGAYHPGAGRGIHIDRAWRGVAADARHARPDSTAGTLHACALAAGPRLLARRAGAFDTYVEAADMGANVELGGRVGRQRPETGCGRTGGRELRLRKSKHFHFLTSG